MKRTAAFFTQAQRGFTLIEVLAALVIVSLGMLAVIGAVGQTVGNATYLREKTLAHWVAMNKLTEVRLNNSAPANGDTSGDVDMAGVTWHWRMTVQATDAATMQRIDIKVAPKSAGDAASIVTLSGFYGTAISQSGGRVSWDPEAGQRRGNNRNGSSSSSSSSESSSSSSRP
jgi:general secretion pathway protein I